MPPRADARNRLATTLAGMLCLWSVGVLIVSGVANREAFAGAPCSGCDSTPCSFGGAVGNYCVADSTGTKTLYLYINTLPFSSPPPPWTVDAGCLGDPTSPVYINKLPSQPMSIFGGAEVSINYIPQNVTLSGDYAIGSCYDCGGCFPPPPSY